MVAPDRSADADPRDWQPATSRPGELYTVEGRIASVGAFARGITRRDPRGRSYRRSMVRSALWCLAACVPVLVLAIALS